MTGFDAGAVVTPLVFTFEPFTSTKGTIPEPTDEQIATFMADVKKIMLRSKNELDLEVDPTDIEAVMSAVDKFEPEKVKTMMADMATAYAALCSNKPTAKQLLAAPLRVRGLFYAWLQNEVVNPEAGPGAGTAQVTPLRRAAAG
ncbi:MAG: hypothetical protein ACRDOK_02605 [Streptosporangiaceae bacterium]